MLKKSFKLGTESLFMLSKSSFSDIVITGSTIFTYYTCLSVSRIRNRFNESSLLGISMYKDFKDFKFLISFNAPISIFLAYRVRDSNLLLNNSFKKSNSTQQFLIVKCLSLGNLSPFRLYICISQLFKLRLFTSELKLLIKGTVSLQFHF